MEVRGALWRFVEVSMEVRGAPWRSPLRSVEVSIEVPASSVLGKSTHDRISPRRRGL